MRRLSSALVLVSIVALSAACAAPATPGWTYAPAPSATPVPSGEASGSPAASAEPSATATATATATAKASTTPAASQTAGASGGATELTVVAPSGAAASGFDPTALEAPAGAAFEVKFDNQDSGVPHNWVLKNPDGSKVDIGDTAFFNGPAEKTYDVPALQPGEYGYLCEVHPQVMTGTLTIQ